MHSGETPYRILVVDDEAAIRALLEMALSAEGHRVETSADPRAAIDQIQAAAYDLVITDINMPGLDGHGLVDAIGARRPGLPVIMMTAKATAETITKSYAQGIRAFLVKPFDDIGEVMEKVDAVLDAARRRRETQSSIRRIRAALSGDGK